MSEEVHDDEGKTKGRVCGACHKLVEPTREEDVARFASTSPASVFAGLTWWLCPACQEAGEPFHDFGVVVDRLHQQAEQHCREHILDTTTSDPVLLWGDDHPFGRKDDSKAEDDSMANGSSQFSSLLDKVVLQRLQICSFLPMPPSEELNEEKLYQCSTVHMHTKEGLWKYCSNLLQRVPGPECPSGIKFSPNAAEVEAYLLEGQRKLQENEHVLPQGFVLANAIAKYCGTHPDDLVLLLYQRLDIELPAPTNQPTFFAGVIVLVDVLPGLDPPARLDAYKKGFMSNLADYTAMKHMTPKGQNKLCMYLYAGFKVCQKQHLGCKRCFPTRKSRREAKEKMYDCTTATILNSKGCGQDHYDKILHLDLFWPDCLPDHAKDDIEWLRDPVERMKVIQEIVGEPSARPEQESEWLKRCPLKFQDFDELLQCVTGGKRDCPLYHRLKKQLDELQPSEYIFAVHFGLTMDNSGIIIRTEDFRPPAIVMKKVSGENIAALSGEPDGRMIDMGGNEGWFQVCMDLKKCGHCHKEEEETESRSFKRCSRCQGEYYCSKKHQVAAWPKHKLFCKEC